MFLVYYKNTNREHKQLKLSGFDFQITVRNGKLIVFVSYKKYEAD